MDGQEVRRRREALNASLQDVASLVGISDETVRKYENGGNVQPKYVDAIIRAIETLEMIRSVVNEVKTKQASSPAVPDRLTRIEQDLAELKQLVQQLLDAQSR